MDIDVGQRLKTLRSKQGLTQRELARRAGVTHVTVSLLERDRINPSLGLLKKVVAGLSMTLGEFFSAEDGAGQRQVFYARDELHLLAEGRITLRQVGANLRGRALQVIMGEYRPGSDTGTQSYSHEGEEAGIVVKGRIEMTVGGQTRILGPGDAYYFESATPHRVRNTGRETCLVIGACTPPSF